MKKNDSTTKRFAPACDRNREPILSVLQQILPSAGRVLEIGSGTGQHAAFFAPHFPNLTWQPSDLADNLASIEAWRIDAGVENIASPLLLDLFAPTWPIDQIDALVCINTVHIVSWTGVENLFRGGVQRLAPGGLLYVYGPFRYRDRPLEPSNVEFDRWLKQRDPESGVREFEAVDDLAHKSGFTLGGDLPMPANNRSIWWRKI